MKRHWCRHCGRALSGRKTRYCDFSCRSAADRAELRSEFIRAYGGKCACCGCAVAEFLSLDHTGPRGIGDLHRRVTKTRGVRMYRLLKAQGWPKDGFRLLCSNCQFCMAWFGRCVHETKPWLFRSEEARQGETYSPTVETLVVSG